MAFTAGQRITAVSLNASTLVPVAPTTASGAGTITSGTTETRDDVLGVYQWTATSGARYRAVLDCAGISATVADDLYQVNIRYRNDSTTPTSSDTLVAQTQALVHVAGGSGQIGIFVSGTFLATASGTNTIALFNKRNAGTGTSQILGFGSGRQLYVMVVGTS